MSNQLAVRNEFSYAELELIAKSMSSSGYFQDAREQSQAIVKILAGREMGFGPFASMTGVYIISGRPSIGANLMASAVKRSGKYDYRVIEMTDQACDLEYTQAGKPIGRSRFTIEDARKAGTKNTDKYPRNMLFARAMSNGVRWYCPDVFEGAAVYTPEELGANVNEAGDVIDIPAPPAPVHPTPKPINPAAVKPLAAPVALGGKTPVITAERVEQAHAAVNAEAPAAEKPSEWNKAVTAQLARDLGIVVNRVVNSLNLSNLEFSADYATASAWMVAYKVNRDMGMTPQEAAAAANE